MSNYDRFRPTAQKDMKERKQEVNQAVYENENQQDGVKRMQIKKDGIYKIRMYPAHPEDKALSIEPKVTYYIPGLKRKKNEKGDFLKDAKGEFIMEQYNRPVFDARVHGQSQFDLVNSFIDIATKQAKAKFGDNKEGLKNALAPIVGNKFSGGTFNGISPTRTYLFYGELIKGDLDNETKEFFEFEVGKAIEKGIQSTAAIENNNDPLGTDGCFTDPIDGLPMKIIVDSQGSKAANDPSLYYKVSLVKDTVKQMINNKMQSIVKDYPISEEELEWFANEVEPLVKYRTVFTRKDLELQLKGLQLFEEEFGFEILSTDEFKDVWNYLDKQFPEVEDNNSNGGENQSNAAPSSSSDEFDLMDKAELKSYIQENDLGIKVLPSMTEQQIREMIREAEVENGNKQYEDTAVTASTEGENEEKTEAENATGGSYKDRIDRLKNKVGQ